MITLTIVDLFIIFLINYIIMIPVFYIIIKQKIDLLNSITLSKNMKNRVKISRLKYDLKNMISWCFIWPYYVLKIKNDANLKIK
jgi:hypothetical protein